MFDVQMTIWTTALRLRVVWLPFSKKTYLCRSDARTSTFVEKPMQLVPVENNSKPEFFEEVKKLTFDPRDDKLKLGQ